ncbi:uncharacterized protein [Anoplolepis gracilipes]|uniref:uncharacterized protein isoform X1 n=2 Tax=Anoplolepis gracilipes TaxID=354296 RepID=UPI003B9F3EE4
MLACVYPRENFEVKTVAVKLHHGKSKRKFKSVVVKEKVPSSTTESTECNNGERVGHELAVGGGGAVLVLSELESMAARQQREIAQQRRLLEQKEARLAVLRGAQEPAQQDRLARLRHKLDQQQSKLNRLRLLRSQTDQSRVNNATLTSDLDCIRALFNEKEKELSLAVAKVEELTRQLEELRGRQNAPAGGGSAGNVGSGLAGSTGNGHLATPASAELEKLRRELMYRNKMNEQQNQMVSQQRQALAQRQAEMASIDARIAQLQSRLQRKRALNQRLAHQLGPNGSGGGRGVVGGANNAGFSDTKLDGFNSGGKLRPTGNIAAIEPYSHIPNDNDFNLNKNDPKYQTLPYNTKFTVNFKTIEDDVNKNKIQHSASASQLGQRPTFQQYGHQIVHSQSQSHIQGQSQLLGSNQQQQQQHNQNLANQPATIQSSCTYNNNNNNNNNSNNLISNAHNFSPDNLSQGLRLHQNHQQQQQSQTQHQNSNVQQKQHNVTGGTSTTSNVVGVTVPSITQVAQNSHRNLQQTVSGHQKPVSSVAPSFSVKSQIYQTSSTKIHPVMPQTLSLLGRGHNNNNNNNTAQNYIGNNQQQATVTTQLQSNVGNQEANYRHGYSAVQQQQQQQQYPNQTAGIHASSPAAVYQVQTSSNLTGFHGTVATTFGNSSQKYNQSQVPNSTDLVQNQDQNQVLNNQKVKFESGKSQDKFEHALSSSNKHEQQQQNRYDQNLTSKYESQQQSGKHDPVGIQAKHEQHLHNIKYESNCQNSQQYGKQHDQQQHEGRVPLKYDHNPTFKHEPSNTSQYKTEPNKYESSGQSKFETMPTKYEPNSTTKHVVDHVIAKFEIPAKTSYEFDSRVTTKSNDGERKNFNESRMDDKTKPALPPKPSKPNPPPRLTHHEKIDVPSSEGINECKMANANLNLRSDKDEDIPPIPTSEPPESPTETQLANHQIIKARPLTLKKAPISEQPKLRYKSNVHVSINRRIEMPPAFLFPETEIPADLMQTEQQQQQQQHQQQIIDTTDNCKSSGITDDIGDSEKLEEADIIDALNVINIEDKPSKMKTDSELTGEVEIDGGKISEVMRRKKGNLKSSSTTGNGSGKVNLSRRVSFDPLALLLDASLEGELELVKKTAKEVANPSSANDEGITALHNAICAGHLEIVKFLVEFGCDVNAQDSDGWTPLHCAASCNNLSMVRFLVEHGACIFATTLSDHETAAEKCEEDEEGFDGCSEYLYSVQEKLGIMNNGQVYAVFDYEAQHADELSLKNGDSVVVLRKGDDNEREWWWSKLGHKEGYVPRNLLGLYPRVQPVKAVD